MPRAVNKQKKTTPPTYQHREFVKAARELGCDEDPAAFDKLLKRIASAPPPLSVQKRKKKPPK